VKVIRNLLLGRVPVLIAAVLAVTSLAPRSSAAAAALKTLYSFCAQGGTNCTDGAVPSAGLMMDAAGHLYGTTQAGGAHHNAGTVFELSPNAAKPQWTETVRYSFCAQGGTDCTDGAMPFGGVIMDAAGHLYGTTGLGGAHDGGTVFELIPNVARTKWTERVLYSFCAQAGTNCTDGLQPVAGLIIGAARHLYGTTQGGGAHNDGTVFELSPDVARTKWTERVLYSFCAQGGTNCTDGAVPSAGLIMGAAGHLYGTTGLGGAHDGGAVFELTPNAARTKWTERVLYSFCAPAGTNCTDGLHPVAGLIIDAAGHLYGTTQGGGAHTDGTVFELTPNAARTKWTERVLYSFCAQGGTICTDGLHPVAGLIIGAAGRLYGTTYGGGAHKQGTVFELSPNAAKTRWTERVLYSFCAQGSTDCTDGAYSSGGLIMDRAGRLYGTTPGGGAHNEGTVFELP
jgi:uncharacterized repeat protein (TIGR03803 family)